MTNPRGVPHGESNGDQNWHDTMGRPPSPTRTRQMWLSARYLAWKWHSTEFFRIASDAIVDLGMDSDTAFLPDLTHGPRVELTDSKIGEIVEFRRMLHFSDARWELA